MRYRSLTRYELLQVGGNEPVLLADAKLHLRVDSSDDDTLISSLITAARRYAEDYCDRTFVVTLWTMKMDSFYGAIGSPVQFGLRADGNNIEGRQGTVPNLDIELPRPLASPTYTDNEGEYITSGVVIRYYPAQGSALTTLSSSSYRVDYDSMPAVCRPLYGQTWPTHLVDQNSVTITWAAGPTLYWEDKGNGPKYGNHNKEVLQAAIKLLVGHLWSNRDASTETALAEIPFGAKALLDTLRWGSYR
jgi:hypothetical protein